MEIINKINSIFNCLLYMRYSVFKNVYPCKLIGKQVVVDNNRSINVLYHFCGQKMSSVISLEEILGNKEIIQLFHPQDAFKLGALGFEAVVASLPEGLAYEKFKKIEEIMLTSVHGISVLSPQEYERPRSSINFVTDLNSVIKNNKYPLKLVGSNLLQRNNKLVITYIVFGKREGYSKSFLELINNQKLLNKFHPTEVLKFGFIAAGKIFFDKEYSRNGK